MVMVGYGHQGEEAVIYLAYFKIICAMGVERRDNGSALFHNNLIKDLSIFANILSYIFMDILGKCAVEKEKD